MTSTDSLAAMPGQLTIDPRSPEPSYAQLARQLRAWIRDGLIGPGEPLPSISQLTGATGLATNTVRHGIAVLVDEGWVVTVAGRGTYVAETLPEG